MDPHSFSLTDPEWNNFRTKKILGNWYLEIVFVQVNLDKFHLVRVAGAGHF